jgi:cold shock CspA family protein
VPLFSGRQPAVGFNKENGAMQETHTGYISRLNLDRHFGFIRIDGRERDLFFHGSALASGLVFNSQLQFMRVEVTIGKDRYSDRELATRVKPAD